MGFLRFRKCVYEVSNSMFVFGLSESELVVVADLDGRIYLVDTGSRKILWSFASGQPIYSSYRAFLNNDKDKSNGSELSNSDNDFYIDCGDDWSLYLHKKSFKKVVRKLSFLYVSCVL